MGGVFYVAVAYVDIFVITPLTQKAIMEWRQNENTITTKKLVRSEESVSTATSTDYRQLANSLALYKHTLLHK